MFIHYTKPLCFYIYNKISKFIRNQSPSNLTKPLVNIALPLSRFGGLCFMSIFKLDLELRYFFIDS